MPDILAYWHAVEMFDPHDIPRETRRGKREPGDECVEVIRVVPGEPVPLMPWQPGHWRYGEQPKQKRNGSAWRHTVYGGVFSFGAVRKAFSLTFGYVEGEDFGGKRKNEDSALFAFTVDENGILIDDTGAFSSCAWATGRLERLRRSELGALDGFNPVAKASIRVTLASLQTAGRSAALTGGRPRSGPVSVLDARRHGEADSLPCTSAGSHVVPAMNSAIPASSWRTATAIQPGPSSAAPHPQDPHPRFPTAVPGPTCGRRPAARMAAGQRPATIP